MSAHHAFGVHIRRYCSSIRSYMRNTVHARGTIIRIPSLPLLLRAVTLRSPLPAIATPMPPPAYNPFKVSLELTNVPPHIRPSHIHHILSRPPMWQGPIKKREPGIEL